jgi:MoaA/NifB/PqqE/SkfB family radical SAM enzyme
MKSISIPSAFNSYWGVFLTLGCNYTCPFCIQKLAGPVPHYDIASGDKWIAALNSIEGRTQKRFLRRNKVKKLALIGGEPTLHPDFFDIVNGLDYDWNLTVTTNLGTKVFDDIGIFAKKIKRKKKIRFHLSFHDGCDGMDEFIAKARDLKRAGMDVNRIFTVCYPPNEPERFEEYQRIFKKNGLSLRKQRYNGFYKDKLYPSGGDENGFEFKDNITDYEAYHKGCSMARKEQVYCKVNKILFAPNGDVHNCHYKVYTGSGDHYGNLFSSGPVINVPQDYFLCNDYGFCNPCDWPYAEFRSVESS